MILLEVISKFLVMASIYHLCSIPPIIVNHYPNHSKTSIRPLNYKSKDVYTRLRTPLIFKRRTIFSFTGTNLLAKAQKDSGPLTSHESDTKTTPGRKNTEPGIQLFLADRARLYTKMMRIVHMGSWFFTVPTWWAIALAADPGTLVDAKMLALFGVAGVLTHGIACTINDYFDRDIDAKVERTKLRPLVTGEVTPSEALCSLGFQVLLGYGLLLPVNDISRILWISSMLLNFTYPLMKRVTYWAQGYLGLAVNFSVLYGWSAVKGSLDAHILLPLYIAGACFTIVYDTIYAHQDKEDDEKIGLKSTAILFGNLTKEWTTGFTAASIGGLTLTGFLADIDMVSRPRTLSRDMTGSASEGRIPGAFSLINTARWPFYAFLAAASAQFAWQIWRVDLSSLADCGKTFQTSAIFGALVFLGIVFGRLCQ